MPRYWGQNYQKFEPEILKHRQTRCTRRAAFLGMIIGCFLGLIIILIITLAIFLPGRRCVIIGEDPETDLNFPFNSTDNEVKFIVNFNLTTMQANYVRYISTSGGNGCKGCKFRDDPYKIDQLTPEDYQVISKEYDRGHLVPNADYGAVTYVINNIVPMKRKFNQGAWLKSEQYIRETYSGYQVYKGCDYNDMNYVQIPGNFPGESGGKLYIPKGCYYVILDSDHILQDYGYFLNQDDPELESELPYWAVCRN